MIKGVLFDKDGTLFDFAASWGAWAATFLERLAKGKQVLADGLAEAIGFDRNSGSFNENSPAIAGTPDDVARAVAPVIGVEVSQLSQLINASAGQAAMVPAVPLSPLLGGLSARGLKLGVATNDGEAAARTHLANANVEQHFDFVAGFDSGWAPKPAPDMCLGFAETMAIDPRDCVMVGDSLHDLHAGRDAGMLVVGVTTGVAGAQSLGPHADVVLPDIGHLPNWLASL